MLSLSLPWQSPGEEGLGAADRRGLRRASDLSHPQTREAPAAAPHRPAKTRGRARGSEAGEEKKIVTLMEFFNACKRNTYDNFNIKGRGR